MFGRSLRINNNQFTWHNPFQQPMYVLADKHQLMLQSIKRQPLLILKTSEASTGLKSITVKKDVLTLIYADNIYGYDALTSTKIGTHVKTKFTYGHREDANHHLWHFGKMNFEDPHVHIIKTFFDPKHFTKLIKPRQFAGILCDLARNYPQYLSKKDADNLKSSYKDFFDKHTSFAITKKHRLFVSIPNQKKSQTSKEHEKEVAPRVR